MCDVCVCAHTQQGDRIIPKRIRRHTNNNVSVPVRSNRTRGWGSISFVEIWTWHSPDRGVHTETAPFNHTRDRIVRAWSAYAQGARPPPSPLALALRQTNL
eukprot:scaffold12811_cov120-Isochrysis_galbana.AAC.3